jgi:signal peptidase I
MIRLLVASVCLVAALGGFAVASFKGTAVADDDTAQRVAALETVVSLQGAEIGAIRTELEFVKAHLSAGGPEGNSFRMDGSSTAPTIRDGDLLLIDEEAYTSRVPERGDIILFDPPVASEKPYVKRVIGLPGETIEIGTDGYVYVNGQRLDEPYTAAGSTECDMRVCKAVTVPEGNVYVLGDNRRNSSDSRIFGPVDIDDIIGKAQIV